MRTMQVRDAKASLSAVIEAAERGEPTTITRHGRPAAVVVPVEDAHRLYGSRKGALAAHLLAFPGGVDAERDAAPLRDAGL